jgi:hypothetical protein
MMDGMMSGGMMWTMGPPLAPCRHCAVARSGCADQIPLRQEVNCKHYPNGAHVGRAAGAVHFSKVDMSACNVPPAIVGRKQPNRRHCPTAAGPKRKPAR